MSELRPDYKYSYYPLSELRGFVCPTCHDRYGEANHHRELVLKNCAKCKAKKASLVQESAKVPNRYLPVSHKQ
jgi:hypothetical protein